MALHQFLAFGIAALILIAIPGPSVMFVVGRALAHGRRTALASVVGNAFGLYTVAALVALGLGRLLAASMVAFDAVKFAGAAYLVFLGVQAIRKRTRGHGPHAADAAAGFWRSAVEGYLVGVANPKALIIFASVLPQFVDRGAGSATIQMLLLALVAFVVALVSDSVWAVLAGGVRAWFGRSTSRTAAVQTVGGLSMIGLGLSIAVTGRKD